MFTIVVSKNQQDAFSISTLQALHKECGGSLTFRMTQVTYQGIYSKWPKLEVVCRRCEVKRFLAPDGATEVLSILNDGKERKLEGEKVLIFSSSGSEILRHEDDVVTVVLGE